MAITERTNERLVAAIGKVSSEVGARTESSEETNEAFRVIMETAIEESSGFSRMTTSVSRLPAFVGVPNVPIESALEDKPAGAAVIFFIYKPASIPNADGPLTFTSTKTMSILDLSGDVTEGNSVSVNKGDVISFANNPAGTQIEVARIR